MKHPPKRLIENFRFNRFSICWTNNDDIPYDATVKTNTVHSLLDYGDYDKMKEFFYVLYAYRTNNNHEDDNDANR